MRSAAAAASCCAVFATRSAAYSVESIASGNRACTESGCEGALPAPYLLGCLFRLKFRKPAVLHALETAWQRRWYRRRLLLLLLCWHAHCPACAIEVGRRSTWACRRINSRHLKVTRHHSHAMHALLTLHLVIDAGVLLGVSWLYNNNALPTFARPLRAGGI